MKVIRITILIVLLVCVLVGAAGFLYMETVAKSDIHQWLSRTLKAEVMIKHANYFWPFGLRLQGVEINNFMVVDKVYLSFTFEDVSSFFKAWFQKEEMLSLPADISWDNFRIIISDNARRDKALSDQVQKMFKLFQLKGNIKVILELASKDLSLKHLRFEGDVITEGE